MGDIARTVVNRPPENSGRTKGIATWLGCLTLRCTATAGVPFTFDVFFFIGYFGCAPPLPPPAVGELDSLGHLALPVFDLVRFLEGIEFALDSFEFDAPTRTVETPHPIVAHRFEDGI